LVFLKIEGLGKVVVVGYVNAVRFGAAFAFFLCLVSSVIAGADCAPAKSLKSYGSSCRASKSLADDILLEQHFAALFYGQNKEVTRRSVHFGASFLKLAWKSAYYKNCKKSFSKKEQEAQAKLFSGLDDAQKKACLDAFQWLCDGYVAISAPLCDDGIVVPSGACSADLLYRFIRKVFSVAQVKDPQGFLFLRNFITPDGTLFLPTKNFVHAYRQYDFVEGLQQLDGVLLVIRLKIDKLLRAVSSLFSLQGLHGCACLAIVLSNAHFLRCKK
jgi:hypothetical protein